MKIKPEHLQYLKDKILPNITEEIKNSYEEGAFLRSDKTKNLQLRFNFDMLHYFVGSRWVCENIYSYANDEHLETALRSFMPKVEKRF